MLHRRTVDRALLALVMTTALTFAVRQHTSADSDHGHADWTMIGHDITNTRNQPAERRIDPDNVDQLSPRWILTTAGDISATPAVSREGNKPGNGQGRKGLFLYFPDWGGRLWKVDAETGNVQWWRLISE